MAFYTGPLPSAQNPESGDENETQPAFKNQPRTIRLLVASLRIESNWMNVQAVNDLITIGAPAVPYLVKALRDDHPQAWRLASVALVKIGQPAVDALIYALDDENQQVRLLAAAALYKMGALKKGDPGWEKMWYEYSKLINEQKAAKTGE